MSRRTDPTRPSPGRVVHVNLARGFRGGERQTALLVEGLAARGVPQRLVVRRGAGLVGRLSDAIDVLPLAWPYLGLVSAVRGASLVHAHDGRAVAPASMAARIAGVPLVITRRIHPLPSARSLGAYRRAAAVAALSRGVRDGLADATGRTDIEVIPSALAHLAVDPERVAALRARFAGRTLAVCAAALVQSQKGQAGLIDAMRLLRDDHPGLVLALLGSGPDEAAFRERARGLDSVVFEGFVEDPGTWLAAADLFVLPSLHEGLGSVLLDAFDAGLPVIATRIPGVVDVVTDGVDGLLVPPADPRALADALRRLLTDPALAASLATHAKRRAADFTPARMVDRYVALYRRLGVPIDG